MAISEIVQLVGHVREYARAVGLRGIAAITIAVAQLLELIVQIPHRMLLKSNLV
jgi:dienelactone hydrolase